jgi:hypothetical protein
MKVAAVLDSGDEGRAERRIFTQKALSACT